ncbi:MAG: polyphosphate kinase 1 [Tannerella sp.]|jgi:polyphosphate kinase|nr:polyphosphate kinase 1 [Tannerella sp.]
MKEKKYSYFKRDVSWLSFNYRVLMEADDETLPVYERIRFLSIYASNLEEFYEVRVSEHRGNILKKNFVDESAETSEESLDNITREVNRQQQDFYRIFHEGILPELLRKKIFLYHDSRPEAFHLDDVRNYFNDEVFPFLSPVTIQKGVRTFIRDRRLYLIVKMSDKVSAEPYYVLIKIPFSKVPRFIPLPARDGVYYYMFVDDIIRANLPFIFPGYDVEGCFSIKISRDADIYINDNNSDAKEIVNEIRTKVGKRKTGVLSRFMYDRAMPRDMLDYICATFDIEADDLVVGGRYMNLQDLIKLPNPVGAELEQTVPQPARVEYLDRIGSMFKAVMQDDVLLHFPYQSFDYLLRFLMEASFDKDVEEIKITQYRVAENSAVINSLISAAQNGKKVTVFVELKARFDEENNVSTAEEMEFAGVKIIYSIPGLKVHAKVAVILRKGDNKDFAYLSTGNFNEKTARIYSDMALLTCNSELVEDVNNLFVGLEQKADSLTFKHLLVARFNMVPEIIRMIEREIEHVKQGRKGYIILKMNGLHDKQMIDVLYRASESGVVIDLIVRGICCLVPGQPYSKNVRITRIVDMFLEHSRVWYFYNDGKEDLYLTSSDWMRRNISRRIETAFPVLCPEIKSEIIRILRLQLADNVKACTIDENLNNVFKRNDNAPVRAQQAIYDFVASRQLKVFDVDS